MSSVDEREPASGGCLLETSVLRKRWTSSAYISSRCHFVSANWDESSVWCWVTTAMWLRQCKVYGPDNDEYRRNYCDGRQHFRKSWWWFSPLIGTVLKYSKRDLTELFSFELRTTIKGNEYSCRPTFCSCVLCVINKLTVMKQKNTEFMYMGEEKGTAEREFIIFQELSPSDSLRSLAWPK